MNEKTQTLCIECGAGMETRRENYRYTASGLPHVTLHQVEVSRCPHCGETEVAIPHIEALHRALAKAIIQHPTRLAPEEIRYLRKYLGWAGVDFAAIMGVDPATVSRWERGATPMGPQADRLLRTLVVNLAPVQDYSPDRLQALLTAIVEEATPHVLYVGLDANEKDWVAQETALASV